MDLVTAAISSALATFANEAIKESAKKTVASAYDTLKEKIAERFGAKSEVVSVVEEVESLTPTTISSSQAFRTLERLNLEKDNEIAQAARKLEESSKAANVNQRSVEIHLKDSKSIGSVYTEGCTNVRVEGSNG
ncbi:MULTISPECIES: hypothetical protein [unclassified Caballeronia]|uniref:hypothetical protein n=1 Tax=unclassified Caballeronia TaxID=2646786 RepID=UPI00158990DB|nr:MULTISPECIES: hypothetical protein [unclassified Caballeronia]QSN63513.1 hypothetical protein JYK05_14930 [Caballeronia sp. M1242]